MLKNHPKGLLVAFFANMGERFGFYTMMAILVLFLQAKYDLSEENAGYIYGVFYFLIYALALVGGLIADRTQNYKGTIMIGIVTMLMGYVLMAVPGFGLPLTVAGLFVIAFGNGLFKGNLQALVGQMYDAPQYAKQRDIAFNIFHMGINIGAFFAPSAAKGIRNWFLEQNKLGYDADLPYLCHRMVKGELTDTAKLQELANNVTNTTVTDLASFAENYINIFSTGYNYAFGIAAGAMVISLLTYILFKSLLPDRKNQAAVNTDIPPMSKEEEKQRFIALGLVFGVVIFFWMSFHQNGLTLTFFARDFTDKTVGNFTNMFFDLKAFLSIIGAVLGIVLIAGKGNSAPVRIGGLALTILGSYLAYYFYSGYPVANTIEPETFQQFNPIFIVFLTPVIVAVFSWMRMKGIEPSTPRKIGIGMLIAALGYMVMIFGSFGLPSPHDLQGSISPERVSPYWLMGNYLVLTVAELFLSPMGISFVSKVSPPRYQGLMQGGWLGATAIGNQLLIVGSFFWMRIEIWQVWLIFVVFCLLSATFIFSVMKRLENVTK